MSQVTYTRVPAALQLYTLRRQLAEDFPGALRRIRDIGYSAVETYPFPPGISSSRAAEVFESLGLRVIAMHSDLPTAARLPHLEQTAKRLNCRRVVWHGWPRPPEHDSIDGIKRLARRYNQTLALLEDHGFDFGLHNHWWEFEPLDGATPCRILNDLLQPKIFLEIDVYWVQTAGANPAAAISELAPRIRILHLKDGPAIHGPPMTALGKGSLNFREILQAAAPGVDLVVELDECADDIFETVDLSLRHLRDIAPERFMNQT